MLLRSHELQINDGQNTQQKQFNDLKQFYSYEVCIQKLKDGPIGKKDGVEKDLEILQTMKFIQAFLILITITASYLNMVTAQNPWSLKPQFTNPSVMLVLLGN